MNFKLWLELDYMSIGHNYDGKYDAWYIDEDSNDIAYASKVGKNPEDHHIGYHEYSGRIDHNKKMISMLPQGYRDPDRIKYVSSLLKMDYPDYAVYFFGGVLQEPKRISESRVVQIVAPPEWGVNYEHQAIENPTPEDVMSLGSSIRGTLTGDGDVYVWKEFDGLHADFYRITGYQRHADFYIYNHGKDRFIHLVNPAYTDDVKSNPNIKKLLRVFKMYEE